MLRKLTTKGFRGLGDFTMDGLGRINLLVGTNNCGKTSVLEALHILLSFGNPETIWSSLSRRGEFSNHNQDPYGLNMVNIRHVFEGHSIKIGSEFYISSEHTDGPIALEARIEPRSIHRRTSRKTIRTPDGRTIFPGLPATFLKWNKSNTSIIYLDDDGNFSASQIEKSEDYTNSIGAEERPVVDLITTKSLSARETVARLESSIMTENEDILVRALRSVEPDLERIAPLGSQISSREGNGRGGVIIKLSNMKERVPLGSMGDGMWRMLGIALSLTHVKRGVLLIDEIDTGLHHTVMEKMWHLVYETAKQLDVQVFATTHSRDCYQSLASVAPDRADSDQPEITIHRIEKGKPHTISFSDDEIRAAAEFDTEVR